MSTTQEVLCSLAGRSITYPVAELNGPTAEHAVMRTLYKAYGTKGPSLLIQEAIKQVLGRSIKFEDFHPDVLEKDPVISVIIEEYGDKAREALSLEMMMIFGQFCDDTRGPQGDSETPEYQAESDLRDDVYDLL